jgi:hypothetical protein
MILPPQKGPHQTNKLLHSWSWATVVSRLSTHPFKYASQLSTHFLAKNLGFKIY